jgi:AmiR/NasT family two-component response regulator
LVQAYLGAAARLLAQCNQLEQSRLLALQLQGALESRVVIEQAKGILAERNRQDLAAAFEELRRQSRNGGVPISEVAKSVTQLGEAS